MGSGADERIILRDAIGTWTESKSNDRQVGGSHYRTKIQHWDYAISNDLGYMEGQITKYITRWNKKNGLQDLEKALHFLERLIEGVKSGDIKYPTVKTSQEKYNQSFNERYPDMNKSAAQLATDI